MMFCGSVDQNNILFIYFVSNTSISCFYFYLYFKMMRSTDQFEYKSPVQALLDSAQEIRWHLDDRKCLILASNYTFSALTHQNNCLAGHIHFIVQFLWSFVFQGFKKRKWKERNKTNLFPNYKNTLCWCTYTHPYNWCIWYSTYNSKPYNAFDILLQSQTTTESLILHLTLEIKNIYMQQWYFW